MCPGLNGPDGVLAAARPDGAVDGGGVAAAVAVVAVGSRDGLGLEHDGAFGLVDQAELTEPEGDGVRRGPETRKVLHEDGNRGILSRHGHRLARCPNFPQNIRGWKKQENI